MNRTAVLLLALCLAVASSLRATEPMTFEELSLMLRTGESPREILNDATRRKLLQPLTSGQQETLREQGAPPALLNALQAPGLVASPDQAAAYRSHHQPPPLQIASAPSMPQPANRPTSAPPQPVLLPDRFLDGIEAAKDIPEQPVRITDALRLDQLAEARVQAQRDRKPIGFIMMAPAFLDKPVTTRTPGGTSALLHFCHAFRESLVLVFVPMDTKPETLPPAVAAGLSAKELNGVVPSMAVVDATTNALIVSVPSGNNKTAGIDRDKVFVAAAAVMQRWLSYHPMAIGVPPGSQAAR